MNIELIIQDRATGLIYDMSELVNKIDWTTELEGQPGKLEFIYVDPDNLSLSKGSVVVLKINGKGVFYGFIFDNTMNQNEEVKITAYDQLRYLKNKDTYVLPSLTSSQIFEKICKEKKLSYKIAQSSNYKCPAKVYDNESYYNMIQDAVDLTLVRTGEWFMIRDNFGSLEHVNINNLKSDLFIGDLSLLNQYEFTSSIDKDSYNKVKIIKEDKETKKREVYIVEDSKNISQWGELQYFEKSDEKANPAQIKERAERILKLRNRETKTLKLACLGDFRVFAGVGVVLGIEQLVNDGIPINQYYITKACKHSFENNHHTMSLEMQVII